MRITTDKGELELPNDISMTIEKRNPFFSDEGDASLPITLPPTPNNMKTLGWMDRTDRHEKYTNTVAARISEGFIDKDAELVLASVSEEDGIDAVLAFDNAGVYAKEKERTLREILSSYDEGRGYRRVFASLNTAMIVMQVVYHGNATDPDFVVFQAATERGENIEYYNETNDELNLVWQARTITRGEEKIAVPAGYGITPFIRLHRLIDIIFECLGYRVAENRLSTSYADIVVMHNCADSIVTGTLYYADLVPDFTLADFIEWMKCRFNIMPVVEEGTKTVRIVSLEEVITDDAVTDITELALGRPTIKPCETNRIVLSVNSGEATPAAESFDKLLEKYGGYVECDEILYNGMDYYTPDALYLRLATGTFFVTERKTGTGEIVKRDIGTNYFNYDRHNSKTTTEENAEETLPAMYVTDPNNEGDRTIHAITMPVIGKMTNRHTSIAGEEEEQTEQKMMTAWALHMDTEEYYQGGITIGTTQKKAFLDDFRDTSAPHELTPHGIYADFWKKYNEMLLNASPDVAMKLVMTKGQFASTRMDKPLIFAGRKLIPVTASAEWRKSHVVTADFEFKMSATFADHVSDTPITPVEEPTLRWNLDRTSINSVVRKYIYDHFPYYTDRDGHIIMQGEESLGGKDPLTLYPTGASVLYIEERHSTTYTDDSVYLGVPLTEGERRTIATKADTEFTVNIYMILDGRWNATGQRTMTTELEGESEFVAVAV